MSKSTVASSREAPSFPCELRQIAYPLPLSCSKDLSVEIPIFIAHPTSLPPAAHDHIAAQLHSTTPAPAFPSLPAFPGASPTPAPYLNPYQVSPVDPYSDFTPHGLYSPATTATTSSVGQGHGHSMSSASRQHATLYHRPSVSAAAASPSPYFAPPPSVPPELAYGHQQQQYIAFDPNAPDLTQSHFLQSLQHQQPTQAYVPPNSSMSIGLGTPSPASTRTNSPTSGVDPSAPWGAPNGVVFAPPPPPPPILSPPPPGHPASQVYTAEPPNAHTSFSPAPHVPSSPYTLSHSPSSFSPIHAHSPSPAELAQIAHNIGPIEGYSATTRARGRTESTPPASYQPIVPPNPSPSPVPMHRSHSASSISRERPPPPPSPSAGASRFTASPGPVSPLGGTAEGSVGMGGDPALLETIGEDGESQAGTARSVQAEMRKALAGLEEGNEDPAVLARRMEEAARISSPKATSRPTFASRSSLQDLEDLIQQEEEAKALQTNKTLPGPAVPSARTKPSSPAPRAQDVFAAPAVDPPRSPIKLPSRSEGGLSALEARLSSRPTTPSSSVERSMSPPKPNVTARALSPSSEAGAGFGGALLARSLSRASSEAELRKRLAEESEDPKEVVRRAVEKASWASIGKAEGKKGEQSEKFEVVAFAKPMAGRPTFVSKRKAVPSFESPATSPEPIAPASVATETPFTPPTATDAPAASLASPPPRLSPSAPSTSPLPSPTILNGRKVVDAAEVKGLQKEAVGRVSDWLKSDESGSNQAGEKAARRRTTDLTFGRVAPAPPGGEAGAALRSPPMAKVPSPWTSRKPRTPSTGEPAVVTAAPTATPSVGSTPVPAAAPRPSHKYTQSLPVNVVKSSSPPPSNEPTMAELLAAEERSGSTSAPATGKPSFKLGGKATRGLKTEEDISTRYDVRSARGGQGGIVASRANVWKERVQEVEVSPGA